MAASSPNDCFISAYMAAILAMEHMTPVILLSDGYIGQGSELFRIPKLADLPSITPPIAKPNEKNYSPYRRDEKTLIRKWALPGTEGLRHSLPPAWSEKTRLEQSMQKKPPPSIQKKWWSGGW